MLSPLNHSTPPPPRPNSAFGIKVSSHILTLRISQDVGVNCTSAAAASGCSNEAGGIHSMGPLCYSLAVKDPLVEVYNATSVAEGFKQYVGLMASDISLYEMASSQAEAGGGRAESCQGARFWDINTDSDRGPHDMHNIPFIHRTSLETSWMTENVKIPTSQSSGSGMSGSRSNIMSKSALVHMNSVLSRSKHRALGVRVLICEEPSAPMQSPRRRGASQMMTMKSTHIHISLRDMTYRIDPLSRWFNRIPELFTNIGTSEDSPPSPSQAPEVAASSTSLTTEFNRTRLSISVQKLLVDFCQPKLSAYEGAESRLLLSIGNLQLSSTLVSNSPRVGLKLLVNDVSIRIGNRLLRNPLLEQSPVDVDGRYIEEYLLEDESHRVSGRRDISHQHQQPLVLSLDFDSFIDVHQIVTMGNIDHLECKLDLNAAYKAPPLSPDKKYLQGSITQNSDKCVAVSFEATAGTLFLYGCADSLHLLAVSMCVYIDLFNLE